MSERKRKPKFRVGQVVRINTDWYRGQHKMEQYQRITRVFLWGTKFHVVMIGSANSFGYCLLNGDECHEKYLKPLTAKELGRKFR